jgi:hypothetical protein
MSITLFSNCARQTSAAAASTSSLRRTQRQHVRHGKAPALSHLCHPTLTPARHCRNGAKRSRGDALAAAGPSTQIPCAIIELAGTSACRAQGGARLRCQAALAPCCRFVHFKPKACVRVGITLQSRYFPSWPSLAHGPSDRALRMHSRAVLRCKRSWLVCTQPMRSISNSSPATRRSATGAAALRLGRAPIVLTSVACLLATSPRNLRPLPNSSPSRGTKLLRRSSSPFILVFCCVRTCLIELTVGRDPLRLHKHVS